MALSDAAKQRKLVDQFLAAPQPEGNGYLGTLNEGINQGRAQRLAAQRTNRAIGGGPWRGKTPFSNVPQMNPSGVGGRAIIAEGLGPVPPVGSRGQLALGAGSRGPLPAIPGPQGVATIPGQPALPPGAQTALPAGPGQAALPAGAQPPALGAGTPALPAGGPTSTGATGGATRAAAASADDLVGTAGRAAASGADDVAAAAANQAGRAVNAAEGAGMRGIATNLGVNITKASMMRGAGVAGAGLMASQFFDGLDLGGENGFVDRTGTGAILGAGLAGGGAIALGLASGPVGWAALGGAVLFGGYQALWGDDETTPEKMNKSVDRTRESITELGAMYGIEGSAMQDILLQYEASTKMYLDNGDSEGLKAFMAGMGTQLPSLMLAAREQQKTEQQDKQRYNDMIAAQAQFAPIFEQSMQHAQQNNATAYQASVDAAGVLQGSNPNLAALYRQTAAQNQAAASNLHAAYAKQMVTAPRQAQNADELQRMMQQEQLMNQALVGMG